MNKKLLAIWILSFIASLNASYLTYQAFQIKAKLASWSFCDISNTFSCTSVFNNDFAWFWNIPFSEIALIVYPILVILAISWLKWFKNASKYILALSIWWLIFNGYIIFNEFQIGSFCLLCLICTWIIIINWILAFINTKQWKN